MTTAGSRSSEGHAIAEARVFHGVTVANPQAWLGATDSAEVLQWAAAQHAAAGECLSQFSGVASAREFLERNHCAVDPAWHATRAGRRFVLVRRPGLPHHVLCERDAAGAERVLLDPNSAAMKPDPDQISVSPSGNFVAVLLASGGNALGTLQVLDTATGAILEASDFRTVMSLVAWHPQESGFYYSLCRSLFEQQERRDGVYWHALGTPWGEDRCVCDYHDGPGHIAHAVIPAGSDVLLLCTRHFSSGMSGVRFCRIPDAPPHAQGPPEMRVLFTELESYIQFLGMVDGYLYFHTCADAPNGRIVAVDPNRPERAAWRTVVAEGELAIARPERFSGPAKSTASADGLLIAYVEDAHDTFRHFGVDGNLLHRLEPPVLSTADGVFACDGGYEIHTQSFLVPRAVYRWEARDGVMRECSRMTMPDVVPADYELRQLFVSAGDGARVPMYVLHRAGLVLDGTHPALLYGYGGFGQAITPEYSPEIALWLSLGGIYAVANIRGGGEYGESWHAAGCRLRKQTTFDDFYAAAEHLIALGYTTAERLVARGISNGGLLTAVCVNQRADLFAAVVSEVPLTDLMWLSDTASGRSVAAEFGSPTESQEVLAALTGYSPLQNVRPGRRTPAQIVVVADQDQSALPGQAYQYVAARQEAVRQSDDYSCVLLRIVHGEGHTDWPPEVTRRVLAEEVGFLWHFAGAGERARLRQRRDLRVPMRDAIELSANVWLPVGAGPFAAVLLRTPYGNDTADFERLGLRAYAEAGYAVVFQSVRGRGKSQGEFGFFFVEGADGHDSIEWVAAQEWCNGKVAMDGGSYLGTVQWLAARERPPHLVCMMPAVPAGDWFNEIPYQGGALQVDFAFSWLGAMGGLSFDFDTSGDANLEKYRPLMDAGSVLGGELPLYKEILSHPTLDDWWQRLYLASADFAGIDLPVLTVTGWFDGDQAGSLYYWAGIEAHSPAAARMNLIVGPWEHRQCYLGGEASLGELTFGPDAILPLRQMRLAFLDQHLRGVCRPTEPRVRLFVTGSNRWHAFGAYPPASTQSQAWFLQSGGHANTARGDGHLGLGAAAGAPDTYVYDPAAPVPYKCAAQDHREIEGREDVLVYTSGALPEAVTVIGPVEAIIYASSSATDTDFTAKLLDVHPDGRAISLTHVGGVLRARYRTSYSDPVLLEPGRVEMFRIRLSHVGHTFLPGHSIRLEVSSSCFPLVDPNPNTGRDIATETECRLAQQSVFHDLQHPSQLLLPVWRGAGIEMKDSRKGAH